MNLFVDLNEIEDDLAIIKILIVGIYIIPFYTILA